MFEINYSEVLANWLPPVLPALIKLAGVFLLAATPILIIKFIHNKRRKIILKK